MREALMLLINENKKNEVIINKLTKQRKDAKHGRDNTKIELVIAKGKVRDVETKMKQKKHYKDKQQQIEKECLEQEGENNRYKQMKELEEQKRKKYEKKME